MTSQHGAALKHDSKKPGTHSGHRQFVSNWEPSRKKSEPLRSFSKAINMQELGEPRDSQESEFWTCHLP